MSMKMKKVLVTIPVSEKHQDQFENISAKLTFTYTSEEEVTQKMVKDADIIIGNVPPEYIKGSKKLELMQCSSAGVVAYTVPGVVDPDTILCNSTGAYGLAISEHMIAELLELIKNLNKYYVNQVNHQWKDEGPVRSIWGSTTLVLGAGDIGSEFAQKMNALGSTVIGVRRHRTEAPAYMKAVYTMDEADGLLKKADFVACCLPGTKETCHFFTPERLKKMKRSAILINIGRGSLVASDVLADALKNHVIGGACLDVTEPEPLPSDSPLWDAPNLILTPHVSGFYHLNETHERVIRIALHNLKAAVEGTPFINEVDRSSGYRKFEENRK
jgi:phosphoglycerate dehydrogenase-like enzyme